MKLKLFAYTAVVFAATPTLRRGADQRPAGTRSRF